MDVFDFHERKGSGVDSETEALATQVIGAAIDVHRLVRPGQAEVVYQRAMSIELDLLGVPHICEKHVPLHYKGRLVGSGKIDILVAERLVLELKAVERLTEVHCAQTIAYLQAMHLQLGLLVNFNVARLKQGLRRIVNTFGI